jgi:hypothetical protein
MKGLKPFLGLWALAAFCVVPSNAAVSAVPGTINYVEGQVTVDDGQTVTPGAVGSARLDTNQMIETGQGRAEILLTPGIFLRVGDHSSVRMISPALADTRVEVLSGDAVVEANQVFNDSNVSVVVGLTRSRLEKKGLYDFNASTGKVAVLDGKLEVFNNDQHIDVGKGKEVTVAGPLKANHFDRDALKQQNPMYAWSRLRSEYDSEAAMQSASTVIVGGPGWWGPGWYWNPWWGMYSFVPGAGMLYSPFGWPYYSPFVVYSAPALRYGYGLNRGFVSSGVAAAPHFRGGFAARGFGGGGFHR